MTQVQLIEAAVVIAIYMVIRFFLLRYVDKLVSRRLSSPKRSVVVKKAINLIVLAIFTTVLISVLGVDQSELALFIGSVLTVIGIALFAQWSILANITSGLILFFYHSVKLDETIIIMEKDYEIEGKIIDIGLFFTILHTANNEQIDIPNSVFLNKMIKKKTHA